jgi:hypothetical protein
MLKAVDAGIGREISAITLAQCHQIEGNQKRYSPLQRSTPKVLSLTIIVPLRAVELLLSYTVGERTRRIGR